MVEKQKKDRYEMHKYWGKKPAKDLKKLIEKYTKENDTILDPFSGYGVFCCEAYLLNRNVISNDLNPIANFINRQILNSEFNLDKFNAEWIQIKNEFKLFINNWYSYKFGEFNVQLLNVLRDSNNLPIKGKFRDPNSNKNIEVEFSKEYQLLFLEFENNYKIEDWYPQNLLIENSRISAKKDLKVCDLFTTRTLSCHAKLLSLIKEISTGAEKDLFLLAFTANLANCSKLVPPIKTRGEMSQGAWMTGFYVGPTYIENNVLHYYENRVKKIIKGKIDIKENYDDLFKNHTSSYKITQFDAKALDLKDESIDYVFTDPPYGDAVPYFEQSIIWNSWLNFEPNYENEIVISDSKLRGKNIEHFEKDVFEAFSEINRVLKKDGHFSLTYHSLSGNEWRAITNACIKNGFEVESFDWLVQKSFTPRQINREKTIKGDVLVTFRKGNSKDYIYKNDFETEIYVIEEVKKLNNTTTNDVFIHLMDQILKNKILIGNIDILNVLKKNFVFTEEEKWIIK